MDRADAALGRLDPLDMGTVVELHAARCRKIGDGLGQLVHAALDAPDASGLGLPDQRKDRGRTVRRAAYISGIAPE